MCWFFVTEPLSADTLMDIVRSANFIFLQPHYSGHAAFQSVAPVMWKYYINGHGNV